jgi:hypothetical protein
MLMLTDFQLLVYDRESLAFQNLWSECRLPFEDSRMQQIIDPVHINIGTDLLENAGARMPSRNLSNLAGRAVSNVNLPKTSSSSGGSTETKVAKANVAHAAEITKLKKTLASMTARYDDQLKATRKLRTNLSSAQRQQNGRQNGNNLRSTAQPWRQQQAPQKPITEGKRQVDVREGGQKGNAAC